MNVKDITSKTFDFFRNNGGNIVCVGVAAAVLSSVPSEANLEKYDPNVNNNPKPIVETFDYKSPVIMKTEDGREVIEPEDTVKIITDDGENVYKVDLDNLSEDKVKIISQNIIERIGEVDEDEILFTVTSPWKKSNKYQLSNKKQGPKINESDHRQYQRTVRIIKPKKEFNWDYFMNGSEIDYEKILKYYEEGDKEQVFEVVRDEQEIIEVTVEKEKELNLNKIELKVEGTDLVVEILTREAQTNELRLTALVGGGIIILLIIPGIIAVKNGHPWYAAYK